MIGDIPERSRILGMADLWQKSAGELARLIRIREVSSVEVVQAHLDRITAVNGSLDAVTVVLEDALRAMPPAAFIRSTTGALLAFSGSSAVRCEVEPTAPRAWIARQVFPLFRLLLFLTLTPFLALACLVARAALLPVLLSFRVLVFSLLGLVAIGPIRLGLPSGLDRRLGDGPRWGSLLIAGTPTAQGSRRARRQRGWGSGPAS